MFVPGSLTAFEAVLDLVVPPSCACCGGSLPAGFARRKTRWSPTAPDLCERCVRDLVDPRERCRRCGEPVGMPHRECRRGGAQEIAVVGGYDGDLRSAVLRSKRPSGEVVARALGSLWAAVHADRCGEWSVDIVVPVPMHWRRRLLRGTSAADRMALAIGAAVGIPVVRGLRRSRSTPMQNELPRDRRRDNVAGAFVAVGRRLSRRRVLLVDDVVTTGATLAACTKAAVRGGADVVYAAAIVRADAGG